MLGTKRTSVYKIACELLCGLGCFGTNLSIFFFAFNLAVFTFIHMRIHLQNTLQINLAIQMKPVLNL